MYKVFDTLGIKSWDDDEPFAVYGLIAESFELADDKLSLTVRLRPEARFADGVPLTADDVVFSYNLIFDPDVNPGARLAWANVRSVERIDEHTVRFAFKTYSRDVPITVTYLTVYPKHIYGAPGRRLTDFNEVLPVGSGPMRWNPIRSENVLCSDAATTTGRRSFPTARDSSTGST